MSPFTSLFTPKARPLYAPQGPCKHQTIYNHPPQEDTEYHPLHTSIHIYHPLIITSIDTDQVHCFLYFCWALHKDKYLHRLKPTAPSQHLIQQSLLHSFTPSLLGSQSFLPASESLPFSIQPLFPWSRVHFRRDFASLKVNFHPHRTILLLANSWILGADNLNNLCLILAASSP